MTCTQTQTLLDAYADAELGHIAAFRVRRHLAGCADCAAQLAGIQRLNTSVQAWRDVLAPAGLEHRIAAALPPIFLAPTKTRDRRIARRAAVGLAGVAVATAAGFWLLPGHPAQPTLAYADVQRAMQQVQIVSWKSHRIVTDANWHPLRNQKSAGSYSVTWLRRDPAAIATIGQPHGYISLSDGRGNMEHTAQGNYVMYPPNHVVGLAEDIERQIKALTEEPAPVSPTSTPKFRSKFTKFQQQSVLLGGQECILFTFDGEAVTSAIVSQGRTMFPQTHYFTHRSLWVDPATHLVTRTELRQWVHYDYTGKQFDQPNQRMISVDSDFRYNQAPPPGVFDWSPPLGANIIDVRDLRVGKGLCLYLPKKSQKETTK
jgi:anti-sigma factor RsiW